MIKEEAYLRKNHPVMWLAMKHHRTHKGQMLDFVKRPFLRQIYMENQPFDVMKSTQCGLTEYLTALAMTLSIEGKSIFYILPTLELVGRFVRNRIDRSIEFSKFYQGQVSSSEFKRTASISLKHIGKGTIAYVGSNTPKAFTEFPADVKITDELDQCNQANVAMGVERLAESDDRREWDISNPTILQYGIHKKYLKSNQFHWHIKCPHCGHWVQPDFFRNILKNEGQDNYRILDDHYEWDSGKDLNMVCDKCFKPIDRRSEGEWVNKKTSARHGYQISKLFTTNVTLAEIVGRFNEGLTDVDIMQRVYNADLGLPYTAEGSKLTDKALDACVAGDPIGYTGGVCVIGIDVGSMLHIRINEVTNDGFLKAVFIGSVKDEDDIDRLFVQYKIVAGVIDANPEARMSERLCMRHAGLFRCYYGEVKKDSVDIDQKIITVRRTSALDNVLDAILTRKIVLPMDIKSHPEYYDHMKASTRILNMQANAGKGAYQWVETSADHLFHAEGYALIARNMLASMAGR